MRHFSMFGLSGLTWQRSLLRRVVLLFMCAALVLSLNFTSAGRVQAAGNLVQNGDFEMNGGLGQVTAGVSSLTGWTVGAAVDSAPYPFVFVVNTDADDSGFPSIYTLLYGSPSIYLWGPGTGSNNGFTGSPNGGYFAGGHGSYGMAPLSQSITGLTPGNSYTLNFDWAVGQVTDVTGNSLQQYWEVTFGSDTVNTPACDIPSKGFCSWASYTYTFVATASTQTLTFLAHGQMGAGPFLLLDGVSLVEYIPPAFGLHNGDFEVSGGIGQVGYNTFITNWTLGNTVDASPNPAVFVVDNSADSTGFSHMWGTSWIHGPNNGVNNGFAGSPNGGSFIGVHGSFATAPLLQTIYSLVPGHYYTLRFSWAASQTSDASGDTSQSWQVTFGSDSVTTSVFNLPSHGFSGWMDFSHTFTAAAATQQLSLLAMGGTGNGPLLLLDGVTLVETGPNAVSLQALTATSGGRTALPLIGLAAIPMLGAFILVKRRRVRL